MSGLSLNLNPRQGFCLSHPSLRFTYHLKDLVIKYGKSNRVFYIEVGCSKNIEPNAHSHALGLPCVPYGIWTALGLPCVLP